MLPKVFLSHSKLNKTFIEKVYDVLKKCQIDPWLDTEEIRAGKPWLKVIFEEGIPKCDAVLVYFTSESLSSAMVSKEVDASLIHSMNNSNIGFLPFVESESVRTKLRSDIQTLQC